LRRLRGRKSNLQKQAGLALLDENEATKNWEYAVLVCDTPYKLEHIGQLYRDRADCRPWQTRGLYEIKNQWGRARTSPVLWTGGAWRGAKPLAWRGLQGGAGTARKTSNAAR